MAQGPPQRDRLARVLVAILIVVALMVLAVAYAIFTAPRPVSPAPFVDLSSPTFGSAGDATFSVREVSREVALGSFRVDGLDVHEATIVFSAVLAPGNLYSSAGAVARFVDVAPMGSLGVDDTFEIENFPTSVTYSVTLVYVPSDRTVASVTIPL